MSKVVGDIAVTVGANTIDLERGFNRAGKKTKEMGRNFETMQKRMEKSAAKIRKAVIGIGLPLSALAVATRKAITELDGIGKTASQIGLTAEALQELHFGATSAGLSIPELNGNMEKFSKRLGEAAAGTGAAKKQLEAWNLSAQELSQMRLEEALDIIADKMAGIQNPTQRAAAAAALFGREGLSMINMLQNGSRGLSEFRREARDTGAIIENDVIKKAEDLEDQLGRTTLVLKREFQEALIAVGPYLVGAAEGATALANGVTAISTAITELHALATQGLDAAFGDGGPGTQVSTDAAADLATNRAMGLNQGESGNTGLFLTDPITGEIVTPEELLSREKDRHAKMLEIRANAIKAMTQNNAYTIEDDPEVQATGARHAALIEMEESLQERLAAIRDFAETSNVQSILSGTSEVLGALGQRNDKFLKASRVAASVEGVINAYRAASQTLADPTLPFVAKAPAVAATLAQGIGLVNSLKSASAGGGGGAVAAAPAAAPTPQIYNVHLQGNNVSRDQVEDLFEMMNERLEGGSRINLR